MKVVRQSGHGGPSESEQKSRRNRNVALAVLGLGLGYWWLHDLTTLKPVEDSPAAAARAHKPRVKRSVNLTIEHTPTPFPPAPATPEPLARIPYSPLVPPPMVGDEDVSPEVPQSHTVIVTVIDSNGNPVDRALVDSEDCGFFRQAFGGSVAIETTEDACTVQAGRRDGALMAWSDPVYVEFLGDEPVSVTLTLPAERTAGMGLQVAKDEGGIRVIGVIPGSPAEKAGLIAGDLVKGVDGVQTADLSVREFVELGTGPLGTEVSITIERETESARSGMDLTLVRQLIDSPSIEMR